MTLIFLESHFQETCKFAHLTIETTRTFIPVVKSHIFIAATPTLDEKVIYMAFFHYLYIYYAKCGYRFMNKCELEIFSNKMTLLTI